MTQSELSQPRVQVDYGIDAPPLVRLFSLIGGGLIVAGMVLYFVLAGSQPAWALTLLIIGVLAGLPLLATVGLMVRGSRVGKRQRAEYLMDLLKLQSDETVLDLGCGRGLLLIAAAKRLPRGKAVGLDLWSTRDLSDNRPEATLANAAAEGVAERVEVKTGDMQQMPFPDGTFDVVVASLAIHNIMSAEGRGKAIREVARVLKPGGQVALQDIMATGEYEQTLRGLGWKDVARSGLNFAIYPPVRVVTGHKPG